MKASKEIPEWLTLSIEGAQVLLSTPSAVNGVKVDRLSMRSPTIREVRAAEASVPDDEDKREFVLFGGLTEAGHLDIEGLTVRDYKRLQTAYFRLVKEDEL